MGLPSDERLARRAARGDRRAFEAIYRRYDQALYRFCLALVGNPQDAQDALQNTMVKALRALPGERRSIQLKPWLYRVARNESIEVLRRRRESAELDPELEAGGDVAETAAARERLRTLLGDLGQLPERQREVLVMRELSGLAFAEIGEALGTSAAVARQALYEARLSLRQLEAGREMRCEDVMRELSDADGRVVRRREIRSHLRDCADCRAFQESIGRRRDQLAAIAPLPLAVSAGLLQGALGAQGGAAAAGGIGAGAGAAVATTTIAKTAATVAVATVVGVSAADRGGLVDLPLPSGDRGAATTEELQRPAPRPGPSRAAAATGILPALGSARSTPSDPDRPAAQQDARDNSEATGHGAGPNAAYAPQGTAPGSAGSNPPGGGHGSGGGERRGRPEALPAAAGRGQQTAAGRRSAHAGKPSRRGAAAGNGKNSGGKTAGKGKGTPPASPPKAKIIPRPKPPPPPPHPLIPPATDTGAPPASGGKRSDIRPETPAGDEGQP